MRRRATQRDVQFDVVDGRLVRTVTFPDGRSYVQCCTQAVYESVAHAIDENAGQGATVDVLRAALPAPFTQVNVALEFLKERGCAVTRFRKSYPASDFLFEDAMAEYFALSEGG